MIPFQYRKEASNVKREKKELVEYLRSRCNSLVFNQEKLNEITTQIEAENNVPTGITTDIIAGRTNMEEDNEFLLFLICNKIKPDKASVSVCS